MVRNERITPPKAGSKGSRERATCSKPPALVSVAIHWVAARGGGGVPTVHRFSFLSVCRGVHGVGLGDVGKPTIPVGKAFLAFPIVFPQGSQLPADAITRATAGESNSRQWRKKGKGRVFRSRYGWVWRPGEPLRLFLSSQPPTESLGLGCFGGPFRPPETLGAVPSPHPSSANIKTKS